MSLCSGVFTTGMDRFIELRFIVLHKYLHFLQMEGKTLCQQKDDDSLKIQMMVSIF